jgi:hypothetical protein
LARRIAPASVSKWPDVDDGAEDLLDPGVARDLGAQLDRAVDVAEHVPVLACV